MNESHPPNVVKLFITVDASMRLCSMLQLMTALPLSSCKELQGVKT